MSKRISELQDAGALVGDELVEVSRPSPSVTIAATTISADGDDNSFNDSADGFLAAGFAVGDSVRAQGFGTGANNIVSGRITVLTAGKMTIGGTDGDVIVDEAAGASVTITKWETRRTTAQDVGDLGGGGGGGGGTAGKHAIYIAAGGITPSASGGCAPLATIASAANQPDIQTLNFDPTTQEFAQFGIVMPKKWNEGTVTFKAHWSHPATTTNFGVAWQLQGVAVGDDDAIAATFGTEQVVTDTGGTTNDLYTTPESSAITIAGSPQAEDMVFFRVARAPANGADTMAVDARLHGITVYITTDAETDA